MNHWAAYIVKSNEWTIFSGDIFYMTCIGRTLFKVHNSLSRSLSFSIVMFGECASVCACAHASTTDHVCTIGAWIYHFLEMFIIILTIVRRNCLRRIRKWHRNDCRRLHTAQHSTYECTQYAIRRECNSKRLRTILDLLVYLLDAISFESGNRQWKSTFFRSFHLYGAQIRKQTLIDLFRSPTMTYSFASHDAGNKYFCNSVNTRCNYLSHSISHSSTEHCRSTLLYSTN